MNNSLNNKNKLSSIINTGGNTQLLKPNCKRRMSNGHKRTNQGPKFLQFKEEPREEVTLN